ncbi:19819_t:CDS:1 [Rhizophagus irregularis]|nr:19819_t:CDS:1 [Rhizophagus irregularis]
MYYEGYGNHCYTQDAINQIEDLSYISLQVYLPIHLNIFASQTLEGYVLFTHRCPQNILYHINTNELIISKSSLTLIGMARNTFNYFNRDDIRNTIINMM